MEASSSAVHTDHHPGAVADAEVDRLKKEHTELKARLCELNDRLYLSPREEVERKTLQKLKLAKKDRLAMLVGQSGSS